MRLGIYIGQGRIEVQQAERPSCPPGGVLMKTAACGLCSGELMDWYLDRKAPHVLGHEVAGWVVESESSDFLVGDLIAPHHHAPCGECELCKRGAAVHCTQWKATRLDPGGMAEFVAVSAQNLTDTHKFNSTDPKDAALTEPLACVMKSLSRARIQPEDRVAVIGAGALGLMHALAHPGAVVFENSDSRREWAQHLGIEARSPRTEDRFEVIIVCPGRPDAVDFAIKIAAPDARIVLFAPFSPGEHLPLSASEFAYFQDLTFIHSYSCGPADTGKATALIRDGKVKASQVVSNFIELQDLESAYHEAKAGRILKAMVVME